MSASRYDKLRSLLRELFQLDQPDLDFGFYRIMHAKSAEVTQFLEQDLLPQVKPPDPTKELFRTKSLRVTALVEAGDVEVDAVARLGLHGQLPRPVQHGRAGVEEPRADRVIILGDQ